MPGLWMVPTRPSHKPTRSEPVTALASGVEVDAMVHPGQLDYGSFDFVSISICRFAYLYRDQIWVENEIPKEF